MFFDTHAHYDASWFDSDRDALLSALPQFGIGLIVNPGCDLPSSQMAVELAQRYDHVYAAVGFHPSDLEHFSPDSIDQLRVLAQEPKVVAIVREFPQVRGVFHCYSGSLEDAKTLIRLGWNLSFTGSVTYKNAKKLPEVAAWVPEDRFMIETDSPYLLPYPRVKGEKRNDSSNLPRIAAKIAALRGLTEAEVERITTENGKAFFRLP